MSASLKKYAAILVPAVMIAAFFAFRTTVDGCGKFNTFIDKNNSISFCYPNSFDVVYNSGTSVSLGEFDSYDIGPVGYLHFLKASEQSFGAGGVPIFLRLTVSDSGKGTVSDSCRGMGDLDHIRISGVDAVKCEQISMNNHKSVSFVFLTDYNKFVFLSEQYFGESMEVIDEIVSSVVLTR